MKGGRYPKAARVCVALKRRPAGRATSESRWSPDSLVGHQRSAVGSLRCVHPTSHNNTALWDRGRPCSPAVPASAEAAYSHSTHASQAGPPGSTRPHPGIRRPSHGAAQGRSARRAVSFPGIVRIRAGNPVFGALPSHSQPLESQADGLNAHLVGSQTAFLTHLGCQS